MAEVAATTSSRPAFGFASSTATSRSYQCTRGRGLRAESSGGVNERSGGVKRRNGSPVPLFRDFRRHFLVTGELLEDRQQARVEEADLEEHQERQRAVDLVDQRVE